ncbi:hypothetical protein, partial [Bartonella henselae]|uniref:hypothetical protein n=2 Tax=Bartonella henselae TaxID=38323 RepID=UPI000A8C0F59
QPKCQFPKLKRPALLNFKYLPLFNPKPDFQRFSKLGSLFTLLHKFYCEHEASLQLQTLKRSGSQARNLHPIIHTINVVLGIQYQLPQLQCPVILQPKCQFPKLKRPALLNFKYLPCSTQSRTSNASQD